MMARIGVVGFDNVGMRFANNVTGIGQDFGESVPSVSIENTVFEVFHFGIEPFDGSCITFAKHPRNHSACFAVNCLDDPQLSFFLPM